MKIAISSEGKDENSPVSQMSGRAPYYLIFENKKLIKIIKNPFRMGGGGAGFGVAEMLSEEEVNLVISGRFGGSIISIFGTKGIKSKEISGITVKEALEKVD